VPEGMILMLDLTGAYKTYDRQQQRAEVGREWLDLLRLQPGECMVDIGSGPGLFSLMAAELVGPEGLVYSIDVSITSLALLEQLQTERGITQIERIQADATTVTPFERPIQAALVAMMLHHVEVPGRVLSHLFTLLEPGARVIVAEFHPDGPGEMGPSLAKRLGPAQLQTLCTQAGFTITSYWLQSPEHYLFKLRR